MDTSVYKEALLKKRGEIYSSGGAVKPLQATMDVNSRQGDLADQASGNNEVHIQLKLKQTDAKILQAIEEALYRIEKGTYGICRDCGEEIAPARLNAIPRSNTARQYDRMTRPAPCSRSVTDRGWKCDRIPSWRWNGPAMESGYG